MTDTETYTEEPTQQEVLPKPFEVAAVVTAFPTGSQNVDEDEIRDGLQFTWEDIESVAIAMMQQGPWFMGRDVRSPETAWKVARDLFVAMTMLGFDIKPQPLPLAPPEEETPRALTVTHEAREWRSFFDGARSGQAGNSR